MTDAPASAPVVKKNTAAETKGKKSDGKPRFEVKKVRTCLRMVMHDLALTSMSLVERGSPMGLGHCS